MKFCNNCDIFIILIIDQYNCQKLLSNCVSSEEDVHENLNSPLLENNFRKSPKKVYMTGDWQQTTEESDIYSPVRKYYSCRSSNRHSSSNNKCCKTCSAKNSSPFSVRIVPSPNRFTDVMSSVRTLHNSKNEKCDLKSCIFSDKKAEKILEIDKEKATSGSESREGRAQSDISGLTVQKSCDQFDLFAKSVACQLRKMNLNSALKTQKAIQRILKCPESLEQSIKSTETEIKSLVDTPENCISKKTSTKNIGTETEVVKEKIHCRDKSNTLRTYKSTRASCLKPKSHYYLKHDTKCNTNNGNTWRY